MSLHFNVDVSCEHGRWNASVQSMVSSLEGMGPQRTTSGNSEAAQGYLVWSRDPPQHNHIQHQNTCMVTGFVVCYKTVKPSPLPYPPPTHHPLKVH